MRPIACTNSHPRRCGYTLLELILVLAILGALAGIAWPLLDNVLAERQLKESVEDVRITLAGTRLKAIDSGRVYQFRYEPGGRQYVVVPAEHGAFDQSERASGAAGASGSNLRAASGELPEDLTFGPAGDAPAFAAPLPQEFSALLADGPALTAAQWSPPLLFFPDGSATSDVVRVIDARKQFMELAVRDLTGAVSVGPVRREAN